MRILRALIATTVTVTAGSSVIDAQRPSRPADKVRVLPVRGNVFMIAGGGANVVASVGRDGVLLVDTGEAIMSETVVAAVRDLSRQVTASRAPQRSCVGMAPGCSWWSGSTFLPTTAAPPPPRGVVGIINTSFDPDHMGGNAAFVAAHRAGAVPWIIAHENAALDVPKSRQVSPEALPTETYFGTNKKLNFINGEGVVVWHRPKAHTSGDSIVQFRESEVLVAGDVLDMTRYPVIDVERGGTVQGLIDGLNWILDLAVVEHMMEGGTMIVPGHGRLTDSADVAYYRDMVTIVRDRVREMRARGMTAGQIKAARLTRDYDPRFGRDPSWTPDMFVDAVYRTLDVQ
jgi:glyoxylase-like metal-dependent hydrolase (beta-lactamase superfamily II)